MPFLGTPISYIISKVIPIVRLLTKSSDPASQRGRPLSVLILMEPQPQALNPKNMLESLGVRGSCDFMNCAVVYLTPEA